MPWNKVRDCNPHKNYVVCGYRSDSLERDSYRSPNQPSTTAGMRRNPGTVM